MGDVYILISASSLITRLAKKTPDTTKMREIQVFSPFVKSMPEKTPKPKMLIVKGDKPPDIHS